MTWNTGKHIKHAFGRNYMQAMIHCMVTEEVDILMLQEAEGMITDDQGLLREGLRLERHGKVAIVTCIDTTETLRTGTVWRSPNFNSMGITLRLRDDSTIGVLTSYLPSDIDDMAMESPHYDRVTLQHEELVAQAAAHDQSIVGFDANETRSRTERILIRKAKKITPTRECQRCPENERAGHCGRFHDWDTEYTGTKRLHSHLDVYRKNFKDSHRTAPGNGHLYDKSGPTHRDALTHTMPARNMDLSYAKLDYIWVSNDMAVRITGSTLNHETKGWSGKHSTDSYHSAILTKMEWANIWRGQLQDDQNRTELPEGEDVVMGPNLSNLNPETEEKINGETERRFAEIRPKLNEIYNNSSTYGKRTEQEALDYITNEWYRVALDSAIKYLGKATPPAERMQGGSVNNQSKKWDQVYDDLKKASLTGEANLKKVMESERTKESLLWLEDRKVYVPKALEEVKAWLEARDFHRSAVIRVGMDCALDDKATQMKKKRMSASLKPLCAPKFGPYRNEAGKLITDSHEIAKDILAYTKKIASTKESTPLPITSAEEVKVKGILKTPTLEEVREAVRDQSDTANAPGISPRMVKVICLGESTETVRKTRKEQEYDELKEKQASYQEKKDWLQKALDTGRILPEPDHKPIDEPGGDQNDPKRFKKAKRQNLQALEILHMIVSLAFRVRNLPSSEKLSTITGLPKKDPLITGMQDVRPISVGAIIGRIINKVVATRLGNYLSLNSTLDPAQLAFLPGKGIHEAIHAILECLRQSKRAKNNEKGRELYVIFYDISKAYDSVKWSSITQGLKDIGADNDLIEFVANSLEGTQTRMKTDIPGRTTPRVNVYGAIKQGCPLAPLLFIIFMNELHKNCRNVGGYQLECGNQVVSCSPVSSTQQRVLR